MGDEKLKSILIVEDETIMRESLRDWLTDGGYLVDTAKDGEEAQKAIAKKDFGLVLLDLKLPGKDGIEVLREARIMRQQLKAIIITAYPSIPTAVQAIKLGAVDYVPKPFDLDDLEKLIRGTLIPEQGGAIAKLAAVKDKEGLNLTLAGWEYIDAYLYSSKKEKNRNESYQ